MENSYDVPNANNLGRKIKISKNKMGCKEQHITTDDSYEQVLNEFDPTPDEQKENQNYYEESIMSKVVGESSVGGSGSNFGMTRMGEMNILGASQTNIGCSQELVDGNSEEPTDGITVTVPGRTTSKLGSKVKNTGGSNQAIGPDGFKTPRTEEAVDGITNKSHGDMAMDVGQNKKQKNKGGGVAEPVQGTGNWSPESISESTYGDNYNIGDVFKMYSTGNNLLVLEDFNGILNSNFGIDGISESEFCAMMENDDKICFVEHADAQGKYWTKTLAESMPSLNLGKSLGDAISGGDGTYDFDSEPEEDDDFALDDEFETEDDDFEHTLANEGDDCCDFECECGMPDCEACFPMDDMDDMEYDECCESGDVEIEMDECNTGSIGMRAESIQESADVAKKVGADKDGHYTDDDTTNGLAENSDTVKGASTVVGKSEKPDDGVTSKVANNDLKAKQKNTGGNWSTVKENIRSISYYAKKSLKEASSNLQKAGKYSVTLTVRGSDNKPVTFRDLTEAATLYEEYVQAYGDSASMTANFILGGKTLHNENLDCGSVTARGPMIQENKVVFRSVNVANDFADQITSNGNRCLVESHSWGSSVKGKFTMTDAKKAFKTIPAIVG